MATLLLEQFGVEHESDAGNQAPAFSRAIENYSYPGLQDCSSDAANSSGQRGEIRSSLGKCFRDAAANSPELLVELPCAGNSNSFRFSCNITEILNFFSDWSSRLSVSRSSCHQISSGLTLHVTVRWFGMRLLQLSG